MARRLAWRLGISRMELGLGLGRRLGLLRLGLGLRLESILGLATLLVQPMVGRLLRRSELHLSRAVLDLVHGSNEVAEA